MSLLLAPVTAVAEASAAWASPAAPAAQAGPAASAAHAAPAAPAGPAAAAAVAAARALQPGSKGSAVKALQRRLATLKYYPGKIDGRFGTDTLEAVWAFYEVQRLKPHNYVNAAMKRALAHPRAPRKLVRHPAANRIEVNLTREVLVLYRNNKVQLISHVSTGGHYYYCSRGGCGYAVTPTGNFKTTVYMAGWIQVPLGEMYNPVFFIGTAFAIHGETDVPLAPVSHGCVRIPMHIATFFHKLVKVPGEPVYIRY
jgi:lipoprotein-anchoring transpeptidase ErfK/SrfK